MNKAIAIKNCSTNIGNIKVRTTINEAGESLKDVAVVLIYSEFLIKE
jgi:hypothetical protein